MDINIKAMRYTEERYEDSVKIYRDMRNTLDNAKKEGRAEGRAEGKKDKAMEIAKNLLEMDMPINAIMKATGLPHEEIVKLSQR